MGRGEAVSRRIIDRMEGVCSRCRVVTICIVREEGVVNGQRLKRSCVKDICFP